MKTNQAVRDVIDQLAGNLQAMTEGDSAGLDDLRVQLADAIDQADHADLADLLGSALQIIEGLGAGRFDQPDAVSAALAAAISAVQTALKGRKKQLDTALDAAGEALTSLLNTSGPAAAGPGGAPVDAASPPESDASEPGEFAIPEKNDALLFLEDQTARLMALDPDTTNELRTIRDDLMDFIATADSMDVCESVMLTVDLIDQILIGRSEDPARSLQEAIDAMGKAARAEEHGPSDDTDAPAEPDPSAESAPVAAEDNPPAMDDAPASSPEEPPTYAIPADADPDILKEFVAESLDHIANAEGALLELESNPEDNEQINVIFRAFHTIKGTSGFFGLSWIMDLAHKAENLLDRARTGEVKIIGGYADLSLQSCDTLKMMIEAVQGLGPGDPVETPPDVTALMTVLADPEAAGVSDEVDHEDLRVGDILVGQGKATREQVEQAAVEQGAERIGQKLTKGGGVKAQDLAKALRTQKEIKSGSPGASESSIRVSTNRLDSLVDMVGELVIAQSMVAEDPAVTNDTTQRLGRNVSHAGKIIRELQDLSMSLRMVPLKGIFQKMARLVRELGRKSGKAVQFVTEGDDTEIDRNMVEVLNDPLVHMIRNSLDHGLETSEQRAQTDKPATGTVKLSAYHAAGNVVIELNDDGRGLDREKILAKAVERGVIESGKEMTDNEVFNLIFEPGFSTAEKVTDVSGRGVGMDVVRSNIQSIRGRIEIESTLGRGTRIALRLPLTMAITDSMLIRSGDQRYLLPTVSIVESFRPEPEAVTTVVGRGEQVLLRGALIPLFRLYDLYNIPDAATDPTQALLIVIESEGKQCALMVDELLGQQQVVIKSLGEAMGHIPGVSGGAILGDGRVGLILDAAGILQLAHSNGIPAGLAGASF